MMVLSHSLLERLGCRMAQNMLFRGLEYTMTLSFHQFQKIVIIITIVVKLSIIKEENVFSIIARLAYNEYRH